LTPEQLATVRLLAREGNREIVMRQVLGLAAREWRELKADPESGLGDALELGRAEGAGLVITFMRARMEEGSMEAAKWLGEHVYKITKPAPEDASVSRTTNILMLPAPMSEAEFRSIIDGSARAVAPVKEIASGATAR
jgi:hypothetical protein